MRAKFTTFVALVFVVGCGVSADPASEAGASAASAPAITASDVAVLFPVPKVDEPDTMHLYEFVPRDNPPVKAWMSPGSNSDDERQFVLDTFGYTYLAAFRVSLLANSSTEAELRLTFQPLGRSWEDGNYNAHASAETLMHFTYRVPRQEAINLVTRLASLRVDVSEPNRVRTHPQLEAEGYGGPTYDYLRSAIPRIASFDRLTAITSFFQDPGARTQESCLQFCDGGKGTAVCLDYCPNGTFFTPVRDGAPRRNYFHAWRFQVLKVNRGAYSPGTMPHLTDGELSSEPFVGTAVGGSVGIPIFVTRRDEASVANDAQNITLPGTGRLEAAVNRIYDMFDSGQRSQTRKKVDALLDPTVTKRDDTRCLNCHAAPVADWALRAMTAANQSSSAKFNDVTPQVLVHFVQLGKDYDPVVSVFVQRDAELSAAAFNNALRRKPE